MSDRLRSFALLVMMLILFAGTLWMSWDLTLEQEPEAVLQSDREAEKEVAPADFVQLLGQKRLGAEKLEAESAAVLRGVLSKQEVAFNLITGRLALLEAAARFRDLDTQMTDSMRRLVRLRINFPGASDEERYCRQVIYHVQSLLESLHQPSGGVVGRLEAELTERLKNGTLHLPTCSPANDSRLR